MWTQIFETKNLNFALNVRRKISFFKRYLKLPFKETFFNVNLRQNLDLFSKV